MKIEFNSRNYELNEHLKNVTEMKLSKLNKYFDDENVVAKVTFKKEATTLTTEVMLSYAGKFVRASASSDNFYSNIDEVLPKIEGQIRKHRTRFDQHQKNNAFKDDSIFKGADSVKMLNLVKNKRFALRPMTIDEAIEEMELLGHSFYVYLDAKSSTVKVLYLRNDGDLGLIEPEV